jgi:hypothetical protein
MSPEPEGLFLTRTPRTLRVSLAALAARWGSAAAAFFLAAALALRAYVETEPYRVLASRGVRVEGEVTAVGGYVAGKGLVTVEYSFRTPDGRTRSAVEEVLFSRIGSIEMGRPITVTYDPRDPSLFRAGAIEPSRAREELLERWPSLAAAAACAAAGAWVLLSWRRRTWLLRRGAVTRGTVLRREELDDPKGKALRVHYSFSPEGRGDVSAFSDVTRGVFDSLREGSQELVFYDPRRPERSVLYRASRYEIEDI